MKVAIVSLGISNIGSVLSLLQSLDAETVVATSPDDIEAADKVILPGVGSFHEGMKRIRSASWEAALRDFAFNKNRPMLGICLGMQLLASWGDEGGGSAGLNIVSGVVKKLDTVGCNLTIPHVGWNSIEFETGSDLFLGVEQGSDVYFVHSYGFVPSEPAHIAARVDYGVKICAALQCRNVFGTQFHPEKSSKVGVQIITNFLDYVPC